ncbi:hypothetical protein MXB_1207 [Myxobolus squamalis]|nr:hypothetical protein MXB_1207 [Myxobolus squamalis]
MKSPNGLSQRNLAILQLVHLPVHVWVGTLTPFISGWY